MLGQRIDRIEGYGDEPGERGRDDDRTPAARRDGGYHGTQAEHDTIDVDPHDAAVVVIGQRGDVCLSDRCARVEMGEIDAAERGAHIVDDAPPIAGVGDVGPDEPSAELDGDRGAVHLIRVDDRDSRALRAQSAGGRLADARRASRYNRDLSRERRHSASARAS